MAADPPPSTPGPRPVPAPVGALAAGAHLGAYAWWCEELFAVTGGWVPSTVEAPARIHLAELSRLLGELAGELAAHLLRPAAADPRDLVVPPSPEAPAVLALVDADATLERLGGVHRVLVPRLLVGWSTLAEASSVGTGRALGRSVRRARADLSDLWLEGEALLQAHVASVRGGARRVASHLGEVESALVGAGGLVPPPPGPGHIE